MKCQMKQTAYSNFNINMMSNKCEELQVQIMCNSQVRADLKLKPILEVIAEKKE